MRYVDIVLREIHDVQTNTDVTFSKYLKKNQRLSSNQLAAKKIYKYLELFDTKNIEVMWLQIHPKNITVQLFFR